MLQNDSNGFAEMTRKRCKTMNLTDTIYKGFALVKETGKLFLTGEGSSFIFPAKNMITETIRLGAPISVFTEGSRQAHEYDLSDFTVLGASNSGETKEVISLFKQLAAQGHKRRFGLTANERTTLEMLSTRCHVLGCGTEKAVAATKSVVEQGLFCQSIICNLAHGFGTRVMAHQTQAAAAAKTILETELDPDMINAMADAPMIYFAGRDNGVAEELTLKTNEIARKKSDFLEGTYAVHGIEEVMEPDEVVIIIDPFPEEMDKYREVLVEGVHLKVFAIAAEQTVFPTITIPHVYGYDSFLELLAGWNILVSIGVANGVNLDKPLRVRKVGNVFQR